MKLKRSAVEQSGPPVRLVAAIFAAGIVVVLVFGGVQSILGQNTELQRDLDATTAQFQHVSDKLAVATSALVELKSELADKAAKLEMASIVVTESHIELYAFNWAQQIATCILKESKALSAYLIEGNRQESSVESTRHSDYQAFVLDQNDAPSPLREYCMKNGVDQNLLNAWWERAFARTEGEIELDGTEAVEYLQSFGGILVPHSTVIVYTDQILADMSLLVGEWHPDISGLAVSRLWFDR